jgi:hypothetical protein
MKDREPSPKAPQSAENAASESLGTLQAQSPGFSLTAAVSNHSAQPAAQMKSAAPIQRATKMPTTYPWEGVVYGAWSAALRSSPDKDANNPHKNTLADVPKGDHVSVTGKSGDWYAVTWKGKSGYIHTSLIDDPVTRKIEDDFKGKEMKWDQSSASGTTDFANAARDNSKDASGKNTTAMPSVGSSTVMNCWEMVLLAAYQTGMLSRDKLADWYNNDKLDQMMASVDGTYKLGDPATPRPTRGDIVFMNGLNHVVIAQGKQSGGKEAVFSFWPPSDFSVATVKQAIADGKIDTVKKGKIQDTTLEYLADWMKGLGLAPDPITFGRPGW